MLNKMTQVDCAHYEFCKYVSKERWASFYHQLAEVMAFAPLDVLEVGPGPGILNTLLKKFGIKAVTLDHAADLCPDIVASAMDIPFCDNQYDCVCAFQVLEHMPYDKSLAVFRELVRVSRNGVVISLPNANIIWPISVHVPRLGVRFIHVPKPSSIFGFSTPDSQHYWEVGRAGYSRDRIVEDLLKERVKLIKEYRVNEFPYHHFFVFVKSDN